MPEATANAQGAIRASCTSAAAALVSAAALLSQTYAIEWGMPCCGCVVRHLGSLSERCGFAWDTSPSSVQTQVQVLALGRSSNEALASLHQLVMLKALRSLTRLSCGRTCTILLDITRQPHTKRLRPRLLSWKPVVKSMRPFINKMTFSCERFPSRKYNCTPSDVISGSLYASGHNPIVMSEAPDIPCKRPSIFQSMAVRELMQR